MTELILLPRVSYRGREITAPRLRGLLALLAADPRAGCGTTRLVAGLWPDEQPANPAKALQILVSRLRTQLGADVIASTPTGYRLTVAEDQVDASAVLLHAAACARHASAGDQLAALAGAEAGLALWDGTPSGDTGFDDPLSRLRAERLPAYRSLRRARALALSRLGRRAEAVEVLTELAGEHPRDEEVLVELLRCEAATAGPAAALGRYEAYRRELREGLGTDPGPALRAVHQELLAGQAPVVRHGVAHEPNPLLGRDGDIAAVANLLRTSRVTSIVGAGGLGKTRLAHAVSRVAEQRVVQFVALAGVTTDDDVAGEVASVLGVRESAHTAVGHRDVLTGIAAALGSGSALLVLDNCEHVVRGAAGLVGALVAMTRDLRVLTTSRAPLGLSSESVYQLPELPLPTAAELFALRARAARPGVDLPAEAVAEVCRHLDGLPLAVELAAARVRVMSVAEIARHLDDRFTLLRGGTRDAPERHQTLHDVVDWSWNLLEPAGRAAMRALSIFPDGFTADAARHLLGGDALRLLEHLVDQSLLKATDTPSGVRFRMLETVREFSVARREAAGETDRVVDGFLAWARACGTAHHEPLFDADALASSQRARAEQDNLVYALRYALARVDGATVAATSAVLAGLWMVESNYTRATALTAECSWVLSHFHPAPEFVDVTRAACTLFTIYTFLLQGPRAVRSLVTLRRLPPAPPDTLTRAIATVIRAAPELLGPDRSLLKAMCDSDEPMLAGAANGFACYLWESEGDLDRALKAAGRMLDAFERRPSPWMRMLALSRLGELCLRVEQGEEAKRHLEAALRMMGEFGDWPDVVGLRWALAQANLQVGDVDEAERWLRLAALDEVDDADSVVAFGLGVRAEILLARGEIEAGLGLWRQAVDSLRSAWSPFVGIDPDLDPWAMEVQAVTVTAHARHRRLDLVDKIVGGLPGKVCAALTHPVVKPPPTMREFPVIGAMLLALGMVDLDRGATRSGARLVALAERFQCLRNFQPTMSAVRAREAAEAADRPAYADAMSSYAGLNRDQLRAAALAVLRERG